MGSYRYPNSPANLSSDITLVSKQYRSQVIKVLLSLVLFMVFYFFVLALAVGLMYYSAISAIFIISLHAHWITLILGGGLILMAIMFFAFLIKFLFRTVKNEDSSRVEIKEDEHPELFDFVKRVCKETKAPFPKKIFLSPGVNACVFYNSSFLSMFFPVRKNLEIGIGLVNCVNISEFKAIVAHEFGHFSQSSTRIGSYVYRLNGMIHNLLFENEGWTGALQTIANIHGILAFCVSLTVGMVRGVLWFFMEVYKVVNVSYLALSREMEFHADSVAVSVSGSSSIITALHRIEFGQAAFEYTLQGVLQYYEENESLPSNFFQLHQRNMLFLARENKLEIVNGIPVITSSVTQKKTIPSRIQYKDLWATHPNTNEREQNAHRVEVKSEVIEDSPWILFKEAEKVQEKLSRKIGNLNKNAKELINTEQFIQYFGAKEKNHKMNPVYSEFYDSTTNAQEIPVMDDKKYTQEISSLRASDLFGPEIVLRLRKYQQALVDVQTVKQISEGHLKIKKFQFDGKTQYRYYSSEIYEQLKKETEEEEKWIVEHKKKIATWFYCNLLKVNSSRAEDYKQILMFRKRIDDELQPFLKVFEAAVQFYHSLLGRNLSEDDLPDLRLKLSMFYTNLLKLKTLSKEEPVPDSLLQQNLFRDGYKATLFASEFVDPAERPGLNGIIPFIESMQLWLHETAKLDEKIFRISAHLQDEVCVTTSLDSKH